MSTNTQENPLEPTIGGATSAAVPRTPPSILHEPQAKRRLRIYTHSPIVYWWPVWAIGYVMAILTYWRGNEQQIEAIGQPTTWIHPSSNLGVIYFLSLFLVILITNFSVRGLTSGMVIMGGTLLSVILAYIGWWDEVFSWLKGLTVHLTLGAYFWFSTMIFLTWAITVFGLDRMNYWEVTPGQLTREQIFGTGSESFNAQGMALEKERDDLFRHWVLGLGSGDLKIQTSGATHQQFQLRNVLFISSKVDAMQQLISEVPEGPEKA